MKIESICLSFFAFIICNRYCVAVSLQEEGPNSEIERQKKERKREALERFEKVAWKICTGTLPTYILSCSFVEGIN